MPVTTLQLGEYKLAVTDEGAGEPVLMLHGFPDSAHDDQVDALSGAYAVASSVTRILVA